MAAQQIDVSKFADLARLELTEEEAQTFTPQIRSILGYIEKLNELDLDGIEPTAHAAPIYDKMREDIARPGLSREAFLQNAPDRTDDQLRVPKVIEEA